MVKKRKTKPRIKITLTVFCGNDDAESTIKVSGRRWENIQKRAEYKTTAWSWYEGRRHAVAWCVADGKYSIGSNVHEGQHVCEAPVSEFIVQPDGH